jgi:hypothetical protein
LFDEKKGIPYTQCLLLFKRLVGFRYGSRPARRNLSKGEIKFSKPAKIK